MKTRLLINPRAGEASRLGAEALEERVRAALGADADLSIVIMDEDAQASARDCLAGKPDVILVAGGDGTARCVMEAAKGSDCAVIPLPFGTANLLPQRLYGARTPEEIIAEFPGYERRPLHAGEIDGKLFFLMAGFGAVHHMALARETQRGVYNPLEWRRAARRFWLALSRLPARRVRYLVENASAWRSANVLFVAVDGFDALRDASETPREPGLETMAARIRDVGDAFSIGWAAMRDRWRDDPKVHHGWTRRVDLRGRKMRAILDGEPVLIPEESTILFHIDAVHVLVPPEAVAEAAA